MAKIGRAVREAAIRRLADATGFNAALAAVAAEYGIRPFSIDWSAGSRNFFLGPVSPDYIDESAAARYPVAVLYAIGSSNDHESMPRAFSGKVTLGLDFYVTDLAGNAPRSLEDVGDAIEDALYEVFKDGNWPQAWGAANACQTGISLDRHPVEMAGEHWRQTLSFRLRFQVDTD
jgi:hypothetical protein